MEKLVSVIIPTYNDADTLPRAIESVLGQTYSNWEMVVVDDGSTDGTVDILDGYEDERVDVLTHKENKGGAAARNTGVRHTNGDYVAFLDADDEWMPEKLQIQIDEMESRSEEWMAVYCDKETVTNGEEGIEDLLSKLLFSSDRDLKEGGYEIAPRVFMMELELGASTLIVERDAVEEIGGFDPNFERHQDLEFVIRLLKVGRLAYVNQKLVKKYGYNKPEAEVIENVKRKFYSKFEREISEFEEEGYDIVDRHELQLVRDYFEEGKLKDGCKHLRWGHLTKFGTVSRIAWSLLTWLRSKLNT